MKNLLYFAAIAVLFASCSVDSIHQDEAQFETITELKKGDPVNTVCSAGDLVDTKGKIIGIAEAQFVPEKGMVAITLTTTNWKIKSSKVYVGPNIYSEEFNPELFENDKYNFSESFVDGVYKTTYEFPIAHVKKNYCFSASLTISNDSSNESAFTQGKPVQDSENGLYLMNFFNNCL